MLLKAARGVDLEEARRGHNHSLLDDRAAEGPAAAAVVLPLTRSLLQLGIIIRCG